MRKLALLILVTLFITSCESDSTKIARLLKSNDKDDLILGYYLAGEAKDTSYIPMMFRDIYDVRITHKIKFYGTSVYKSKMVALKKISGLNPPKPISYELDTTIINFYKSWAKRKKYIE